jgi:hypothetical protein
MPLAAKARQHVDNMKSAVIRSTAKIHDETDELFGRRLRNGLEKALFLMHRKEHRRVHGTSRHKPHQGAQECARRVRQGVNGTCYVHGAQYPTQF